MTNITLIKKQLPNNLWDSAVKYQIPDDYLNLMPELIIMVLNSKSIDTFEEKQNWFNLMPLMNDDQLSKLKDILEREKLKLQEIEEVYENKKMEIKKKYLMKWQKMGYFKQVSKIQENEQKEKSKEDEEAEKLLDMI